MIDLRSDTVTQPTSAMRSAMAGAEVGDDLYGEDPTVNELQELYASMVGKEAALFVPSGTMANQLALRLLSRPGTSILAGRRSHVVSYENGAAAYNTSAQLQSLDDPFGVLSVDDVRYAIDAAAHHQPVPSLLCLENTHMASGGRFVPVPTVRALADLGLPVHLDGARLFNAAVACGASAAEIAAPATTVMSCLSKGLGAPVGSLLAGPADVMAEARTQRSRLGGGMRQAGILAAAGLVALRTMVDRLADDHARAVRLAEAVETRWPDTGCDPGDVDTNIVVFHHPKVDELLSYLEAQGVLAGSIAPGIVRFVTHLDIDDAAITQAISAIRAAP